MKQGLRAHEFNLTTGDNTTQPQSRPPGSGVQTGGGGDHQHHRSRHHGSHHGHHHSRANSSSSSTSTSSTAPVVNNAHGHHMPTSSTKHMQHPNSASNKHVDQRHHRQDRKLWCFHVKYFFPLENILQFKNYFLPSRSWWKITFEQVDTSYDE